MDIHDVTVAEKAAQRTAAGGAGAPGAEVDMA